MDLVISVLKKALLEKQSFKIERLGWFSVQEISAKINTSKHSFIPPTHQIIFSQNEIPVTLDFETFFTETLKIPVSQAQSQLVTFSEQVLRSLKEIKKYHLEGLGELILQREKIFFIMDPDSELNAKFFGLEEFTMRPGKLRKYPQTKKPKKTFKWWLWILMILVLLAGIGGYFHKDFLLQKFETLKLKYFDKTPLIQDTIQVEVIPQDVVQEEIKKIEEFEDTVTTVITEEFTSERFYLIAGCFKSEENAQKLINQLKDKGFYPKIVGQTAKGLYRVALTESYATKEEALQMRAQCPECWILKH